MPTKTPLRFRFALLAAGLWLATMAGGLAQTFPTVPDHTVLGRVGTGTGSGPSQAVPFATLASKLFVTTPGTLNDFVCFDTSGTAFKDCGFAFGTSVANPGTAALESLLPIQSTVAPSKTFATADLFKETRRSNSGGAMTDTFPASTATGLANGASITIKNVDATASDTVTAGAGTTISGSGVVGPGRAVKYVYDLASTIWRPELNSDTALLGPNNLSDVGSAAAALANLGGVGSATNNTFTGTNAFNKGVLLPGGTTQTSGAFLSQAACLRPEQFGAKDDGATDDTNAVITAANTAAGVKIGLCLTAGSGYSVHPIQFGSTNSLGATGTCTGSISGTTMTISSGCSMDLQAGQTVTGAGVTAGTIINGYGVRSVGGLTNYSSNGQTGTYTVNNSQTVGSEVLTFTAPVMQGSASGTVLTIGTVVSGSIQKGSAVTCTNCPLGLFVTTLGTGTGGVGTYNLNQSVTIGSGTSFTFHPAAPASLPPFIVGDNGTASKFVGNGSGGTFPNQRLITTTTGPLNSAWLFQYWLRNFTVDANSNYGFGLVSLGLNGTLENIYSTGAISDGGSGFGCGELYLGTVLNPVIYGHLRSMTARQNPGANGRCMDGNDGSSSYNLQAIDAVGLFSMGNGGFGWLIDYIGIACLECESESNTGNAVGTDHIAHLEFPDFYTEGNGGAWAGTANSKGIRITGKMNDGINSTLQGCLTCRIKYTDGTSYFSYPSGACIWSDQVGGVTLANTTNCKWMLDDAGMVTVYGQFTYNTASVTNAAAALIGFAGAPTVPNQTYAVLPGSMKSQTGGLGAVWPVPVANTTNFNVWSNGTPGNASITSIANNVLTVKMQYPLN